jgi:chromosome segregation ATPase
MSDTPRMVSARRCQYENPNLPKYIVPYEDAAQVEYELTQCKRELAEAREQLEDFEVEATNAINDIVRVKYQRDTLAEALHSIRHRLGDFQEPWNSRETDIDSIAQQAIAAVKGDSDD